jgi:hypothetical protein
MNNTELLRLFHQREREWVTLLEHVRGAHFTAIGRQSGPIQWHADLNLGTHAWLGFYWLNPPFWFGYGLGQGGWSPVVDASGKGCPIGTVVRLREQLPGIWHEVDFSSKTFWRLWAPAGTPEDNKTHQQWLVERGRELHEFLVEDE